MELKVGDIVEWCGCRGFVNGEYEKEGGFAYIQVYFNDSPCTLVFTKDGKQYDWHKEPSLKLIKRLKRLYKVLYTVEIGDRNDYIMTDGRYSSEFEFKDEYPFNCKFVKFVEETMIEVEE